MASKTTYPVELGRGLELQWDSPRIQRGPLAVDAAFGCNFFQSSTASLAAFFLLDGRNAAGINAYVRRAIFSSSAAQGYSLTYYTGATTFTAGSAYALGLTAFAPAFAVSSGTSGTFIGNGIMAGSCVAGGEVDGCHGDWIVVPSGTALVIQSSKVAANCSGAFIWAEYAD